MYICILYLSFYAYKGNHPRKGDIICIQTNGTHLKNNFYFTYLGSSDRRSKSVYFSQKEGTTSLETMGKKNLRKILILVHNFASTMMNYIYFVLVVEIIVKVKAMANSRNFAKKYGSKFTLVAVLWVGTPKMIRYFTFLMKAGN